MKKLKFSRAEINHAVCLVSRIPQFQAVRNMSISELKRLIRLQCLEDHLELERICKTASGSSLENYNYVVERRSGWTPEDISPAPLINGDDLKEMGLAPGPLYKAILTRVEDEQLEGRIRNRAEAISFVKKNYKL